MLDPEALRLLGTDVDVARLDDLCRRYGIASLAVFGSVARGQAESASDLDLLYELRPGARLGWEIDELVAELTVLFGRPVDLVARRALHPLLRDSVLDEARPVYAA
ncbi:nucleotidyltransferase family protein [Pseudonocardia sp. NPDC049635]|uniref:nucleotidyltransferase family protein n=1 Tax=Pseudonocardia sp. NPDC049635 TaxID=3155506 RepID=UPI0033E6C4FC